ncbi:MAG: DUF1552 domain-containing protein [Verrucomicrobiota bacterium]
MKSVHFNFGQRLSRRHLLRGAGVALGLPLLDAMRPAFGAAGGAANLGQAKRFVGVTLSLGLHNPNLVPKKAGRDYEPSPYLRSLQDIRDQFTVISGSSHPDVSGGHTAEGSILSAAPHSPAVTRPKTVSIDQLLAKHLGHETRFPSLVLNTDGETSPSYTENGSMIPASSDPMKLFTQLFVDDKPAVQKTQAERLRSGRSVMDVIAADTRSLQRQVGREDRDRLDAWFTSIRETERRLEANEAWIHEPKPKVASKGPKEADRNNEPEVMSAFLEIMALALQTDSTRFITLHVTGNGVNAIDGVDESYHSLSHHGRDDEKLDQLARVEESVVREWGEFLRKLQAVKDENGTLLDDTQVLLTSNLGNASSHDNRNMPVLFGGGGYRHGQHLAFDQKQNYPLPNLYLSAIQRAGLELDRFATSSGTMKGLSI